MSLGYFSYALPISVVMAKHGFPFGSHVMVLHHLFVCRRAEHLFAQHATLRLHGRLWLPLRADECLLRSTRPAIPARRQPAENASDTRTQPRRRLHARTLRRLLSPCAIEYTRLESLQSSVGRLLAGGAPRHALFLRASAHLMVLVFPGHTPKLARRAKRSPRGETYYHACCPQYVRSFAWRWLTRDGREARRQLGALQELRQEVGTQALEWSRT